MCAIIDNAVVHEVFGGNPTGAGEFFLRWLARQNGGVLVAGGRLYQELRQNPDFLQFFNDRLLAGRARRIPDADVGSAENALLARRICRSDDAHVLALAQVSGARLLFTNDDALKRDFVNPDIIEGAPGRIYTTNRGRRTRRYAVQQITNVTRTHRALLKRTDLCDLPG